MGRARARGGTLRAVSWEILEDRDDATFARWGSLGVALLKGNVTPASFDRLDTLIGDLSAEGGACSILVVRRGVVSAKMDDTTRAKARSVLTARKDRLRAFAYVYGVSGVSAAVIRKLMSGALAAAGLRGKVFSKEPDAVRWLLEQPGTPAALKSARAAILEALASRE